MKNLFITGTPGVGKTSLIKEVTFPSRDRAAGFYTEEMREGTVRQGFRLVTFETPPRQGVLARKGLKSSVRLNKYGVDLDVLENIGVAALEKGLETTGKLLVIDEIGSMETLSDLFREVLTRCLQSPRHPVLATIRQNAQPFTDTVKKMQDTETVRLTRDNYASVRGRVKDWLEQAMAGRDVR